jgi:hypothetical protein
MRDNQQHVTDATGQDIYTKTAPGVEERERDESNNTNKTTWANVASRREGRTLDSPGDTEARAVAAEMATLETNKNKDDNNAPLREELPSVPGNYQLTPEIQQVRKDKSDSSKKGVVSTQVREQDVEEARGQSGDDVTIRRAKEVKQRPMTLTMDTEDEQTKKGRSQNMTGKPRGGKRGGKEVNITRQRTMQHRRRKRPARSDPKS